MNRITLKNKELFTGRVCEIQKEAYKVLYEGQELMAALRGRFFQSDERPVVGDYVSVCYNEYGESRIEEILPRKSMLKRPDQSGHAIGYVKCMKEQAMVANFDYTFIITSLNDDYSKNRIARYISITLQGNAIPVVILTKADLCECVEARVEEIEQLSKKAQVHAVSAITGEGMEELEKYCKENVTIALIGSSGVGKSTLVNVLAGKEMMKTGEIREKDSKGRHTTTHRELLVLPSGVTLIDTPGMRELGMCDVEQGINDTFSDITRLFANCRFRDCKHQTEPKCAVKQALADGTLQEERWKLYCNLQNESKKAANMKRIGKIQKDRSRRENRY